MHLIFHFLDYSSSSCLYPECQNPLSVAFIWRGLRSTPPNGITSLSEQGNVLGTGVRCRTQQPVPFGNLWTQTPEFLLVNFVFHTKGASRASSVTLCQPASRARRAPTLLGSSSPEKLPLEKHLPSVKCVPEEDPADSFIVIFFFSKHRKCTSCCWSIVQLSLCCLMTLLCLLKQDGDFPAPGIICFASCHSALTLPFSLWL